MVDIVNPLWVTVDSSNNSASPTGWTPASMLPSQVEPTAQAMMGATKRLWERNNPVITTSGASGVYAYTPTNTLYPASYTTGEVYALRTHQASAGNDTLNVNGLGAKNIYKMTGAGVVQLAANDWLSGQDIVLAYDSTLNSSAGGWQWLGGGNVVTGPIAATDSDIALFSGVNGGRIKDGPPLRGLLRAADFTAVSNVRYNVDTTSGAVTATLPASPTANDWIQFSDGLGKWNTNNITLGGNGNTIRGASTYVGSTQYGALFAIWNATASDWEVIQFGGTPAIGGLIKIASASASVSAAVSFTGLDATYNTFFLEGNGIYFSGTPIVYLQTGVGGSPTWNTSSNYANETISQTGGTLVSASNTTGNGNQLTGLVSGSTGTAAYPWSVKIYISNLASTSQHKVAIWWSGGRNAGGTTQYDQGTGYWGNDTTAVTALRIIPNSGTITAGTFDLYGLSI